MSSFQTPRFIRSNGFSSKWKEKEASQFYRRYGYDQPHYTPQYQNSRYFNNKIYRRKLGVSRPYYYFSRQGDFTDKKYSHYNTNTEFNQR